jgi:hypothetical protein
MGRELEMRKRLMFAAALVVLALAVAVPAGLASGGGRHVEPGDDRGAAVQPGDDRGGAAEPGDDRGVDRVVVTTRASKPVSAKAARHVESRHAHRHHGGRRHDG